MAELDYSKDYCRIVTSAPLDDEEVMLYYDIVQSVVHTKLMVGYSDNDKVSVQVIEYHSEHGYIYEIALESQLSLDEGERISDLLAEEFDIDFDFESSIEI